MKVTIIGTGYVGLVTGACLAEMGNHVVCVDVDERKIRILNEGSIPIHEPGLERLVARNAGVGRLQFTTDVAAAIHHGTLLLIGVGTPPEEDGSADLQHVLSAARSIGANMTDYKVVVDKSTVPVGTADAVRLAIGKELERRGIAVDFAVVSNPEFLKEGAAVDIVFDNVPGRIDHARIIGIPKGIGQGQFAASGTLARTSALGGATTFPAVISIPDEMSRESLRLAMSGSATAFAGNAGVIGLLASILVWISSYTAYL